MCHKHSTIKIEFVINLLSYFYVGIAKQCHSYQIVYLNNLHIYPALTRLVLDLTWENMFQYLIVLLITIESVNADGKRLLLTYPYAVAQRLSQLESTVRQLSSTVQQLSSTVHQLSNTVKIQSTTIQQLQQPSSATESMLKVLFVLVNDNVRSIEINVVVSILLSSEDTLSSNDIPYGTTIGFIFSNDQSAISLSNLSTRKLLSDWLLYLSVLHMCIRSKMTANGVLLDVGVPSDKNIIKDTTNIKS